MTSPVEPRSEKFLRFSRRSTTVLLLLVVAVGALCVALAFLPLSPAAWPGAMVPLWIVAIVLVLGLQRTLGGERWDPRDPEVRAIIGDEWRRANMDRARRLAFVVVLGAQLPLGLLLATLPSLRAVMAMASATITLGVATMLAAFLYLDRDAADAG